MKYILPLLCLFFAACSQNPRAMESGVATDSKSELYSQVGQERRVQFEALYRTSYTDLSQLPSADLMAMEIRGTTQFLFGPLTLRELGGVQKGEKVTPQMNQATVQNGRVVLPYKYDAVWLIHKDGVASGTIKLPLPYSAKDLKKTQWLACTDSNPEHQTEWFLWYFWDPSRRRCPHQLGQDYQEVIVQIGAESQQTALSYPEYQRMIHMENGVPVLAMTFAFGYVEDAAAPNPFTDLDEGMREFQKFHSWAQSTLLSLGFVSKPLTQADFGGTGSAVIGTQFTGMKDGVQIRVSVVSNAGIDQMDLFAWSYAHLHEGVFGWFGHSRVGSGFDADRFRQMILFQPQKFSMSPEYQLVYWAGCNGYSYYTTPFFDLKAQLNPTLDPKGTKNLDIISNGLPSLFAFNAMNGWMMLQAVLNWKTPTSYQALINQIEDNASKWPSKVIVNVLGDEDNPLPQ